MYSGQKGEPVAIGNLERFVADYERKNNWRQGLQKQNQQVKRSLLLVLDPQV
jgi:NADPH-dependent glutamate synthase beta chain and related oxidoreductases